MRRRTVALLSLATVLLWAAVKWTTDQILGNFVAEYIAGLLPNSVVSAMTAAIAANAVYLAVALAVVLGAYGLGVVDRRQRPGPTGTTGQPATDFAHGLNASAVTLDMDVLAGKKRNIQLGVQLENMTQVPMRYAVDNMFVSIDNKAHPQPGFSNTGGVIYPGRANKFRYAVFTSLTLPPVAPAIVAVNISYGPVDGPPVRHLRREFSCTLRVQKKPATITWSNDVHEDTAI
jgi:hypothetical protein